MHFLYVTVWVCVYNIEMLSLFDMILIEGIYMNMWEALYGFMCMAEDKVVKGAGEWKGDWYL